MIYIFFEKATTNCTLQKKRFDEKRTAFHTTELVLALEFLHSKVNSFYLSTESIYILRATSIATSSQKT